MYCPKKLPESSPSASAVGALRAKPADRTSQDARCEAGPARGAIA
jgi:hypothetical protein